MDTFENAVRGGVGGGQFHIKQKGVFFVSCNLSSNADFWHYLNFREVLLINRYIIKRIHAFSFLPGNFSSTSGKMNCMPNVRRSHAFAENASHLQVHFHANPTHFHTKSFAQGLILKQRQKLTVFRAVFHLSVESNLR